MIAAAGGLEGIEPQNNDQCSWELPQREPDQKQEGRRPDRINRNVKAIKIDTAILGFYLTILNHMICQGFNWL